VLYSRLILGVALAGLSAADSVPPTLDRILDQMEATDASRSRSLQRYTCLRKYVLTNARFNKRAEVVAKMVWTAPGSKEFDIISQDGTAALRKMVLNRMMEGEKEASEELHGQTPVTRRNYDFRLTGTDTVQDRLCYVLELTPKRESKYLVRGRAWVDATDFAVIRMEGAFSKNPSFWTRGVTITHEYGKHGDFWLPSSSLSQTKARIFGETKVTIEYSEYRIETGEVAASRPASGELSPSR
jgi:hypothetical protein